MPVQRYQYVITIDAESGADADEAMRDMMPVGTAVRTRAYYGSSYSYRVVNWTAHGDPSESPNLTVDGRR